MRSLINHFNKDIKAVFVTGLFILFSSAGFTQLNGTYKIGPADSLDADFHSFAEVADTLNATSGIDGPVVFNVLPGEYKEVHIVLKEIIGASGTNTITFQGSTGDSTDAKLTYTYPNDANQKYMIMLDSTDYVTFKHLTFDATGGDYHYGRVFNLTNGANNNKFLNNVFYGKPRDYYDDCTIIFVYNTLDEDNVFEYNEFNSGEEAIKLDAPSGMFESGTVIRYNIFNDQLHAAIQLHDQDAAIINNNIIHNSNSGKRGIYLDNVDNDFQVLNNDIQMNNPSEAIYLYNCDGGATLKGLVANNFLSLPGTVSTSEGLSLNGCDYVQIYHNSVYLYNAWDENTKAFYQTGGGNLYIQNNIFANLNGGYAYYINSTGAIAESDYNNYYAVAKYLAYWGGNKLDLAALAISSGDNNSISTHPVFISGDDLHTTNFHMSNKGTDLSSVVPEDIDGESRSSTPDLGADEFDTPTGAALSGTITIGPGQTYTTISGAVSEMNNYGISSSVIFNILDDGSPYNERFTILPVTGADVSNTVTFQPDPSNTQDVVISYDAGSESETVNLLRASYITIKNLSIAAVNTINSDVVRLGGYTHHDSIIGCTVNSIGTRTGHAAIMSTYAFLDNIYIVGNEIFDGYSGIFLEGASDRRFTNIMISGNRIESAYNRGIALYYCESPIVTDNIVETGASTYYYWGIELYRCRYNYIITGNIVSNYEGEGGIYANDNEGTAGNVGLIANNFVNIDGNGDTEATGIRTNSTDYVNIYFNTGRIGQTNTNSSSDAFQNNSGSFVNLRNNIFCCFGSGRAFNSNNSTAIESSDYNCFFARTKYVAYWINTNIATFEDYQVVSTKDAHSVFANPVFLASDDLHSNSSVLDGAGVALAGLTDDIDGDLRDDPPDIGADEFTSTLTPMAGIYTIGGTSPDFTTIKSAFDSLMIKGISEPVTLNIRSGQYNEFIGNIYKITGTNSSDTIVLQSETGNPEDVTIYYSTNDNAGTMFSLQSVDYFTIRDLTISATGTSAGRPVGVMGTSKNLQLINNILVSAHNNWSNLWIGECITDKILIKDNKFTKGNHAIYFSGDQNVRSTNTRIIGNSCSGHSNRGIYLEYHTAPKVIHNTINNTTASSFTGIQLNNCYASLEVSANSITSNNSQYGIAIHNCEAVDPFYGLLTNNIIWIGGSSYANGLYINNSDRMYFYHNSVNITSTYYDYTYGLYSENNNNEIELKNNVIAHFGAGRALYIEDGVDITNSDYNNFYSKSTSKFIRVGSTDYTDLVSYVTASGKDAHSISVDPLFYSTTDLHSEEAGLFQAGTPLADVPVDIDSVARTPGNPDIGAYEFTCGTPEWNVVVIPTCLGDTTTYIDISTNIARGSTFSWDFDFDGDYEPDEINKQTNDTLSFYFDAAGEYTTYLHVLQIAGCNDFTTINVTVSDLPSLDITTKGAYCGRDDGEASVEVTGGTSPYDYFWSTGETDTAITGLALGTYTLAVSDANGCTTTEEFTIGDAMQVVVTQIKQSTCGIPDGAAFVTVTGGYEPYSYVWSNGETSDTNKTLSTGKHYVNVIDDSLCYAQGYINIESDGSGPQVALEKVTHNLCYGEKNGVIDISVSGGVGPYSILWSNGATDDSIYNLASGIYDVLVTAADGCMGAGSFQVTQPSKITISTVVEDASCAGSDGKAVAVVSGGTKPYAYMWSTGGIYEIEEGLAAGVYSITITDGRGCQEVKPVIVNNVGGPVVTINSITGASCSNPTDGAIDINVSGGSTPYVSYLWSPGGQITPDISGLSPGSYVVKVTDQAECVGVNTAEVKQAVPEVNPICLVTVDTVTGKNMVVWEKQDITDVDYYVIYRETNLKGIYQPVGIRPVNSLSYFIDTIADPTIRSWRYKLSVVDECGVESELSEHHKTMHLTINVGLDDKINLIWDHYEGFDVNTYDVWRYSASAGWEKLQSMPANLTSYTDVNPPLEDLTYYIEVLHPTGCTSTKAGTLNSSKSNRQSRLKGGTGLPDLLLKKYNLSIYPNPGSGLFNLSVDNLSSENVTLKVFDITGKLVYINEFNNRSNRFETTIDLSGYADGIYHVQLKMNKALFHRVLIKE
ncbi:MAG: hypothetical protein AMS27_09460 [Bacteroides sp. SM23_62_1]|nr:MAG: hypothetical protein AMS27_09460 [Bacteroides sp. SM23_62_1]